MDLHLKGKLALVSGSTAGIGLAIATMLAQEGARVIVNGRQQSSVDKVVSQLGSATRSSVHGFAEDLSTTTVGEALAHAFPEVDILVNNLGIFEPKPFDEILDADWTRFFEVNVLSGIRLARLFLPRMRHANWGRIIFISSESAVQIPAEMIHYGMTKTAQLAVARGLAEATAGTGTTVNSVLPGQQSPGASSSSLTLSRDRKGNHSKHSKRSSLRRFVRPHSSSVSLHLMRLRRSWPTLPAHLHPRRRGPLCELTAGSSRARSKANSSSRRNIPGAWRGRDIGQAPASAPHTIHKLNHQLHLTQWQATPRTPFWARRSIADVPLDHGRRYLRSFSLSSEQQLDKHTTLQQTRGRNITI
jgi:NAD(P)-dependent dehydrogenase (short-subunit alcohol dehydrogenase family)